jgi:hypothetical protein
MYEAPLNFATPTLRLPPFNDSGEVNIADSPDRYELGYARYPKPMLMLPLETSRRGGQMALWFGVEKLAQPQSIPPRGSRNAPASGYAMLQKGAGENATWACMKYGPHGGGHGHFDKLNVVLYARGRMVGVDSGTRAYGSPLHGTWDKTSIAHNTLSIEEKSQAAAQGTSLAFGSDKGVDYAMCDAGPIYDGVRFVRTVALLDENVLLFVDHVNCESPRTIDIAWHHRGRWGKLEGGEPWTPPDVSGYKHVRGGVSRRSESGISLPIDVNENWKSLIVLGGQESTRIITGTGIGANSADQVPMVIFRRQARQTTFVWAITLDGSPIKVDSDGKAIDVRSGPKKWHLDIDSSAGTVRVTVS